jgi:hypothetical protein
MALAAMASRTWLTAIRRYLAAVIAANLLWETAQLPLYTIWRTDPAASLIYAILHCMAGDVGIATVALTLALALTGSAGWPAARRMSVAGAVTAFGIGYTVYSEYLNTAVRQSWAYAEAMPRLPGLGTGLAPFMQWLVIPPFALAWAGRAVAKKGG